MGNIDDAVKHPSHYTEGRKYEPKDVIRDWGLNFNLGSAVKYTARAGRKDDIIQDLKKAQEFIQFEIDAIEAERAKALTSKFPNHPNCRCSTKPHNEEKRGKSGVIVIEAPVGMPPEEIIQKVIKKVYGGE